MRLPFSSAWSHLLQMRGLKREYRYGQNPEPLSHLLQMRGLKQKRGATSTGTQEVASFTDAWIETTVCVIGLTIISVASFTDAWIETYQSAGVFSQCQSHLLQMRGLKRPF